MISEYARYMKGGYQVPDLMKLTRREFMFWYHIHERQIIEEKIITDLVRKNKPIPEGIALRNRVDNYIKKRREELNNNG